MTNGNGETGRAADKELPATPLTLAARSAAPLPFFLIHSLKTENVSDAGLACPGFSLALLVTGRVTLGKSFAKDYRRAGDPRPATRVTLKPHREDKTGKKGGDLGDGPSHELQYSPPLPHPASLPSLLEAVHEEPESGPRGLDGPAPSSSLCKCAAAVKNKLKPP